MTNKETAGRTSPQALVNVQIILIPVVQNIIYKSSMHVSVVIKLVYRTPTVSGDHCGQRKWVKIFKQMGDEKLIPDNK